MSEGCQMETMGTIGVVQNIQGEIKKKMTLKSQTMCFCDMGVTPSKQTRFVGRVQVATYSKGRTGSTGKGMILVE